MKRLLTVIISIVMLINAIPVFAADADCVDSDGDGYVEISNAEQLFWFANEVNGGNIKLNAELTADIKINEGVLLADGEVNTGDFIGWTPIRKYNGKFEGNGHTISGVYCVSDEYYVGLFGDVIKGKISNLTIKDSYFCGTEYVGSICADLNDSSLAHTGKGIISSCINYGTVEVSGEDFIRAGGICGDNYYGDIINCINYGKVSARGTKDVFAGGISAISYGKIKKCINYGTIYSSAEVRYAYSGGISSLVRGGGVENSMNFGGVSSVAKYGLIAGGIVGELGSSPYIKNCINFSGVGVIYTDDEYDRPDLTYCGLICGYNEYGTVYNNYFDKSFLGIAVGVNKGEVENCAGKSLDEIHTPEMAWILNTVCGESVNSGEWSFFNGKLCFANEALFPICKVTYDGQLNYSVLSNAAGTVSTDENYLYVANEEQFTGKDIVSDMAVTVYKRGDVNMSQTIDISDLFAIKGYLLNEDVYLFAFDVNDDSNVNILDLFEIKRILRG